MPMLIWVAIWTSLWGTVVACCDPERYSPNNDCSDGKR